MESPVITISWNQCPEIYHAAAAISTTVKNSGPIDRPLHEELCLRLFIFFFCHHDIVRLDFFIAILIDAKLLVHFLFRSAELDADHCTDRDHDTGNCLNHIPVHKDDLFYVEAGTVHAIGAGVLLAEIQENSNITYRLYDYDRVDRDGKKRELHVEKALRAARLSSSNAPRQPLRTLRYRKGCASELLCRCKYFQVERLLLNTELHRALTDYRTGANSFHALLCTDGCGVLFGEGFMLNFFKGDCMFVPAESIPLKLHGRAQLLDVSC